PPRRFGATIFSKYYVLMQLNDFAVATCPSLSSRIVHQYNPPGHLSEHHRPLPGAAHLPVDEIEQRVDRDLPVLGRLSLKAAQHRIREGAVPDLGRFEGGLKRRTGRHDQLALPLDRLEGPLDDLLVVGTALRRAGEDAPAVAEIEPEEESLA